MGKLISVLEEEEVSQVYELIAEELKTVDDDATIRQTIGLLDGQNWPRVDQAARLRIENRLIKSSLSRPVATTNDPRGARQAA